MLHRSSPYQHRITSAQFWRANYRGIGTPTIPLFSTQLSRTMERCGSLSAFKISFESRSQVGCSYSILDTGLQSFQTADDRNTRIHDIESSFLDFPESCCGLTNTGRPTWSLWTTTTISVRGWNPWQRIRPAFRTCSFTDHRGPENAPESMLFWGLSLDQRHTN